jgi:hypothetical protein
MTKTAAKAKASSRTIELSAKSVNHLQPGPAVSPCPGDEKQMSPPPPPMESALANLQLTITEAHLSVGALVDVLQPYLPMHMFEETLTGSQEDAPDMYPEYGSDLSSSVISVYQSLNELARLARRIQYVSRQVVR